MKIAIVAPSPVPFGVGGAEKLWWGMLEYLNKQTTHQCELIKISVKENSFWDLIDSYYRFHTLDVSSFDLVITGKYPGWMVQHENHHIYMLHRLRGLYDTYPFVGASLTFCRNHPKLDTLLNHLDRGAATPEKVFELLFDLRTDNSIPPGAYDFPGPLIRKIIHFFDKKAMDMVKTFSAISQTVARRKIYFPVNVPVKVVYPPSVLNGFKNSAHAYFFTVSRLDDSKRIQMIIKAYLKTKTILPLKIAGTGPQADSLKRLAKADPRIEFLGFVSDKDLVDCYANAFAVLFVPYDEDYGLITIEAMMCQKPVLTFTDAGGVLEFVTHGQTGLVCPPDIDQLTKQIDSLAQSPELCRKMGKQARKKVEAITWKASMERLLSKPIANKPHANKPGSGLKKITIVTTYPVYPPRGGGQNRTFYLSKELAKSMKVEIVCLVSETSPPGRQEIAPGVHEIRVPKSRAHGKKEWKIEEKAGIPITDIAMLSLACETPEFLGAVTSSAQDADLVIATQPYLFFLLKENISLPLVHDSQNVEYVLKKQMLKQNAFNDNLLNKLFQAEKQACKTALFTTVCAMDDAATMEKLYGFDRSKAVLVPNGVNLENVLFTSKQDKIKLKKSLGLETEKIVVFMGSWHQPNIDAVKDIFKIAEKTPRYRYLIIGSVGGYFAAGKTPANVGFAGVVDDQEKQLCLALADVALNPMGTGSGTNLKMLDYMAAGIPVVSTRVGARGLDIPAGCIVECEIDRFDYYISHIDSHVDVEKSRAYVTENFGWERIATQFHKALLSGIHK